MRDVLKTVWARLSKEPGMQLANLTNIVGEIEKNDINNPHRRFTDSQYESRIRRRLELVRG